jgi:hypothetical protein
MFQELRGQSGGADANTVKEEVRFDTERMSLWSLKPVVAPQIGERTPGLLRALEFGGGVEPIDALVEADEFELRGLSKPQLLQRLTLDLIGLRATVEEVNAFLADDSIGAYERQVDRLLGDPRFGEHWARMWLDVVRYSDSNGFDWDEFRKEAWRYRDFVVAAFNDDLPFDTFMTWQLAGDELAGEALVRGGPASRLERDQLIATGYMRLGPYDNAAKLFNEQDRARVELLADLTETTGSAFLGLTFSCCRCHDHKTDPLTQVDHYRFRAFFAATEFADALSLSVPGGSDEAVGEAAPAERQVGLLMSDKVDGVEAIRVFKQGDHRYAMEEVTVGFPSVLGEPEVVLEVPVHGKTTGRRLALAKWIADPANPWTARVYVNRVWQQLFGRGIVSTPNDFGITGGLPETQGLLDHLASEFVGHGWSTKGLVRRIVQSVEYRRAGSAHRVVRRLSAEQLRDVLLQVTGLLNQRMGGPAVWPEVDQDVLRANPAVLDDNETKTKGWYPSPKSDQTVRSLYLIQKRTIRLPWMETFDLPENTVSCGMRAVSIVPSQALAVMNNEWVCGGAEGLADRVGTIRELYQEIFGREPSGAEKELCKTYMQQRTLRELALVLLNTNELAFVP